MSSLLTVNAHQPCVVDVLYGLGSLFWDGCLSLSTPADTCPTSHDIRDRLISLAGRVEAEEQRLPPEHRPIRLGIDNRQLPATSEKAHLLQQLKHDPHCDLRQHRYGEGSKEADIREALMQKKAAAMVAAAVAAQEQARAAAASLAVAEAEQQEAVSAAQQEAGEEGEPTQSGQPQQEAHAADSDGMALPLQQHQVVDAADQEAAGQQFHPVGSDQLLSCPASAIELSPASGAAGRGQGGQVEGGVVPDQPAPHPTSAVTCDSVDQAPLSCTSLAAAAAAGAAHKQVVKITVLAYEPDTEEEEEEGVSSGPTSPAASDVTLTYATLAPSHDAADGKEEEAALEWGEHTAPDANVPVKEVAGGLAGVEAGGVGQVSPSQVALSGVRPTSAPPALLMGAVPAAVILTHLSDTKAAASTTAKAVETHPLQVQVQGTTSSFDSHGHCLALSDGGCLHGYNSSPASVPRSTGSKGGSPPAPSAGGAGAVQGNDEGTGVVVLLPPVTAGAGSSSGEVTQGQAGGAPGLASQVADMADLVQQGTRISSSGMPTPSVSTLKQGLCGALRLMSWALAAYLSHPVAASP
jgi:hypothetical protein